MVERSILGGVFCLFSTVFHPKRKKKKKQRLSSDIFFLAILVAAHCFLSYCSIVSTLFNIFFADPFFSSVEEYYNDPIFPPCLAFINKAEPSKPITTNPQTPSHNDNLSLQISTMELKNFMEWSQSAKISLTRKGKFKYNPKYA